MNENTDYRSIFLLVISQAFATSCASIVITLGGIIGYSMAPSTSLATLPVSLFAIGVATASLPTAFIMRRYGRIVGFYNGAILVFLGGLCSTYGLYLNSFFIFCLGCIFIGMGNGVAQFYRFAAAEMASHKDRPKVISWVLTGGIASAIIGPQIVFWTHDSISSIPNAAPFLATSILATLVFILTRFINFPTPLTKAITQSTRSIREILSDKRILTAIICAATAYGLMSMVMTAAPVAMEHHSDHSKTDTVLAIQWHVLAMYVPSFFTGNLIARFGQRKIISVGMIFILCAALFAISGLEVMHYWSSLILLGLGWNFSYIGATSLLTESYKEGDKNKVEGLNDFMVFTVTAFASISAGAFLSWFGWQTVNFIVFPAVAIALTMLFLLRSR